MDDDDDFGDLYTDVLCLKSVPTPHPSAAATAAAADDDEEKEENILHVSSLPSVPEQDFSSMVPGRRAASPEDADDDWLLGRNPLPVEEPDNWVENDDDMVVSAIHGTSVVGLPDKAGGPRVFEKGTGVSLDDEADEIGGGESVEKTEEVDDLDEEPLIPGLSSAPVPPKALDSGLVKASRSDDWDSDSEDDLQIVLNDSVHDPHAVEGREGVGSDEDEDLVIVTDEDQHHHHHQVVDDQDWRDDGVQPPADGVKKEMLEVAKVNGVATAASGARIGYSNHSFHPQHHSMFKYVRPGATPMPGGYGIVAAEPPGQARPPSLGSMAGRGRGDWRPVGGRGFPSMQKGFHSGYGLPAWGNSALGRPFGSGLDFTLPSHKTVFDVDIESFEEKLWKSPGADISDFFNFGLDEAHWKEYCKQVEQLRLESTMQSKIKVYESGRSEQDYDPDLPPELAAATGHHDMSADTANHAKLENGQADLNSQGRGSAFMRPPLPTGRAIQVESGYGERLPSIDTRPPRIRDSDAVIEIILQGNLDDATFSNGTLERHENNFGGVNLKGHHDDEDGRPAESENNGFPHNSIGHQRESMARTILVSAVREGTLSFPSESSLQYNSSPKSQSPIDNAMSFGTQHGGRLPKGTSHGRNSSTGEHLRKILPCRNEDFNNQEGHYKGNAGDGLEANQSPELSPSNTVEISRELSIEKDVVHDDRLTLGDSHEEDGEEALVFRVSSEIVGDDSLILSANRKKLSSYVEQSAAQDNGDDDESKITHSDNSRPRSGDSRDHLKRQESGEEVIQDRPTKHTLDFRKHHKEDEHRRSGDYGRDGRRENDRNRALYRGRDMLQPHAHTDWDSGSGHTFLGRSEGFEREMDNSVGAWQRREDDTHSKHLKDEDVRRARNEEIRPKDRSKTRMTDRNEKIDDHIKKRVNDVDWRGHSRDGALRYREREGISLNFRENLEGSQMKRKRDAEITKRDRVDKDDSLHGYRVREDSGRRKRERDGIVDHRKREDDVRTKGKIEESHSTKQKDENWYQRDRDGRQRLKMSHNDTLLLHEREERWLASRIGRPMEEKSLSGSGRSKDDLKVTESGKDYHKDRKRHHEQSKRRERTGEEHEMVNEVRGSLRTREKQFITEDRSSRHVRLSANVDRSPGVSDGHQLRKEKHSESSRRVKDTEPFEHTREVKKKHKDHSTHHTELNFNFSNEQERHKHSTTEGKKALGNADEQMEDPLLSISGHGEEDPASDDENSESRRGRSKLERWTSHKEREYSTIDNNVQTSSFREADDTQDVANEPVKAHTQKTDNTETKSVDVVQIDDKAGEDRERHLDTVAKLKMRSERFKLPMPGEKDKDHIVNKKSDNEAPPCIQNEIASTSADMDIKLERPARKRRWTVS